MFTMTRWASFRQCIDEVDDRVRRLLQEKDVAYRYHYRGGWHVSVTTGSKCVDPKKWYVRIGETERKPKRTGVDLRLSEWLKLKQVVEHLHHDYPNITEYSPCFLTHPLDFVGCIECKPSSLFDIWVRRDCGMFSVGVLLPISWTSSDIETASNSVGINMCIKTTGYRITVCYLSHDTTNKRKRKAMSIV